jgi:response regulator RpfG family c-di-GMP phosphodiesterase
MDRTGDFQVLDPLDVPRLADKGRAGVVPSVDEFLGYIEQSRILGADEGTALDAFLAARPDLLAGDTYGLLEAIVGEGLLNEFQASRLLAGHTFGLVLGNYRVVDRLGTGGMGVVYKAEHIHMKRTVALKVLFLEDDHNPVFLQRFHSEIEAMAVLRHPNIALAFDAGEIAVPDEPVKVLRYLVMEYVPGQNLEQLVVDHGPLPIARACDFVSQAASGLRHAYEHGLVHRDIKPSNLVVTPRNQVKILDFGLARLCRRRCTEAYSMLGTVDYMAPEQARDARSVDIRADIYGLGGTLYWLLTGETPFPGDRSPIEELLARQNEMPAPLRKHRADIPPDLEAIVCQMMARDPSDRYPTPLAVILALNSFVNGSSGGSLSETVVEEPNAAVTSGVSGPRTHRVLIVSSLAACRAACRAALSPAKIECFEVGTPAEVDEAMRRTPCDLIVIDGSLPSGEALALCRRLRQEPPRPHLKLMLLTLAPTAGPAGTTSWTESGADDALVWPAASHEIATRVRIVLRLKESEDRADCLTTHLLHTNAQLEQSLRLRDADSFQAQDVLIFAMAKMAESRGLETGAHLLRMQQYVRALAEEAVSLPAFSGLIDDAFVGMIERCVVLHDIGKVAIPDHVLLKPGRLDAEERSIMESHTVVGANVLEAVARHHGASLAFLQMAIDIVRHHHERWDGGGYPDALSGDAIPLAARIVTVADVYDALRSKLVYKPGLAHAPAKRLILDATQGQFDPSLVAAFRQSEPVFEQIFERTVD